jgi:hypothetical protein
MDKHVFYRCSLAKYAAAFFRMSRSSSKVATFLLSRRLSSNSFAKFSRNCLVVAGSKLSPFDVTVSETIVRAPALNR